MMELEQAAVKDKESNGITGELAIMDFLRFLTFHVKGSRGELS